MATSTLLPRFDRGDPGQQQTRLRPIAGALRARRHARTPRQSPIPGPAACLLQLNQPLIASHRTQSAWTHAGLFDAAFEINLQFHVRFAHCRAGLHAGAGELHMRPLFNLRTAEGVNMFRAIATHVAVLVKKYRGSLSGDHGDGRLRDEFIRLMVGPEYYAMMRRLKETFDPLRAGSRPRGFWVNSRSST